MKFLSLFLLLAFLSACSSDNAPKYECVKYEQQMFTSFIMSGNMLIPNIQYHDVCVEYAYPMDSAYANLFIQE